MKNLNEQSDRIKQLFTEERLYGNLILESSKIILTEDKVIDKGKNELGNSFKLKKDNKGIFTLIGKKNTQLLDWRLFTVVFTVGGHRQRHYLWTKLTTTNS